MYRRLTVTLTDTEAAALAAMAQQDRRYPKQQVGWLIVDAARRRGLLADDRQQHTDRAEFIKEAVTA